MYLENTADESHSCAHHSIQRMLEAAGLCVSGVKATAALDERMADSDVFTAASYHVAIHTCHPNSLLALLLALTQRWDSRF